MSKLSTLDMTREEWLEDRQKGIGGSDVGTILGLNKWKSPYQLWLEKTGEILNEQQDSEPAYWGNILEDIVAKEFTVRTGLKVRRRNQVFEHKEYPFLRANIDRDIIGENAILECKTANAYLNKDWEGEEIPASYLCQVQHYINVLDCDYAYVAVLIGGQKFVVKKVERDQELIDTIQEKLIDFWENNVLKNIPPEIDGSEATTRLLKEMYSDTEDNEITMNKHFDELIEAKKALESSKKEMEKEINKIKNMIIEELGSRDASIGITPQYIINWKARTRKAISAKKIADKYPEIAEDDEIYSISNYRTLTEKEIH